MRPIPYCLHLLIIHKPNIPLHWMRTCPTNRYIQLGTLGCVKNGRHLWMFGRTVASRSLDDEAVPSVRQKPLRTLPPEASLTWLSSESQPFCCCHQISNATCQPFSGCKPSLPPEILSKLQSSAPSLVTQHRPGPQHMLGKFWFTITTPSRSPSTYSLYCADKALEQLTARCSWGWKSKWDVPTLCYPVSWYKRQRQLSITSQTRAEST